MMEIQIDSRGDQVRITLTGSVEGERAEELKRELAKLDLAGVKEAIFDFAGVTRLGSAAIGKLLLFYKNLKIAGRTIGIQRTPPAVYEIFEATDLVRIMKVSR